MQSAFSEDDKGIAIDGYDAVAYFSDHSAVKGHEQFSVEWGGTTWRFSSEANLSDFKQNAERYAPQYGGFCAFAMGFGKPAKADAKTFTIQDGKLYLVASPMVRRFWNIFGKPERSARKWAALRISAEPSQ